MNWFCPTAFVRGSAHVDTGIPCQDYCAVQSFPNNLVIAALSDGAGSAAFASVGARLSVRFTLDFLSKHAVLSSLNEQTFHQMFSALIFELQERLHHVSRILNAPVSEVSCTLLSVVAMPDWSAAVQIGDGLVVRRCANREGYELLFRPYKGEYANETVFLTHPQAPQFVQASFSRNAPRFICLSSDGMERLALVLKQDAYASQSFFRSLEASTRDIADDVQGSAELEAFLSSERVTKRTNDDTSMILLSFRDEPSQEIEAALVTSADQSRG
jgi:hypothetical protein